MKGVEYYENFDLKNIITPVDYKVLDRALTESGYDRKKKDFLVKGFKEGFSIRYQGPKEVKQTSPNLIIRIGTEKDLWNKVMKEVKLKRYAGPFSKIPYRYFIQSPIGLVPKDKGKNTRLIFHLSYPRNSTTATSVNANTPEDECKVHYKSIDDAIQLILAEGKTAVFAGKSDISAAFRNVPLSADQFCWLIMKAKSPFDGKVYYFADKCLPFGSSLSCALFTEISNAITHVMTYRNGKEPVNYLDDFLFIALMKAICNQYLQRFLDFCSEVGFPVALEKTEWASTMITFLGLLINTMNGTVSIPIDKVERAKNMISRLMSKHKMTIHEVQKLCGYLNFLCRAIVPGRSFTTRMYAPLRIRNKQGQLLKKHHHVKITAEMKMDMNVWMGFLETPLAYSRPFIDFSDEWTPEEMNWYTDAAKNSKLGFGGYCNQSYMYGIWGEFIDIHDPSIEFLELYAVTIGVKLWLKNYPNRRITLFCDNDSAVRMINRQSSRCRNCMKLIRVITRESLIHNSRVYAKHVKGVDNGISDSLSRMNFKKFRELTEKKGMTDMKLEDLPEEIFPPNKVWNHI